MAGLFSRLKVWALGEVLKGSDLNAEFNNILANVDATHSEGVSANLSQMQSTEDPGSVGGENLSQPISQAQEDKRLRYVIKRLIGAAQWYSTPDVTLNALNQTVNNSLNLPKNRIISGKVSAFNQPDYIRAGGTNVKLLCTATPFVVVIDGTQYTFNTDITLTGLSAGYTVNHTALNADTFTGGEDSRTAGESISLYQFDSDRSFINMSSVGSQISSRVGQMAAFKIHSLQPIDDYFIARIDSTTKITNLFRGYFRDTSGVPTNVASLVTGETITILRLTYLFLSNAGVLSPLYNEPFYQADTPLSFSAGDYWFDITNDTWKVSIGGVWTASNSTLVGICAQDSTGCVVSRSGDFFKDFANTNEIALGNPPASGSAYSSKRPGGKISVYGKDVTRINEWIWDIATDVDTGLAAAAGVWYFYITDTGDTVLSTVHPNDRFGTLSGFYHPAKPWRCVGFANAASASTWDSTQSFASLSSISLQAIPDESVNLRSMQPRTDRNGYTSPAALGGFAISPPLDNALTTEQTTTSTSPVDITNQSVTLTVSGKHPVWIGFVPDASGTVKEDYFTMYTTGASATMTEAYIYFLRGATVIKKAKFAGYGDVGASFKIAFPATAFGYLDTNVAAGTYTYKAQMSLKDTLRVLAASPNLRLVAYEIH